MNSIAYMQHDSEHEETFTISPSILNQIWAVCNLLFNYILCRLQYGHAVSSVSKNSEEVQYLVDSREVSQDEKFDAEVTTHWIKNMANQFGKRFLCI